MLIVAGIVEGLDPVQSLRDKMQRKLRHGNEGSEMKLEGSSSLEIISEEELKELFD